MVVRSFVGYLNTDLLGGSTTPGVGDTLTIDPSEQLDIIITDGAGDLAVEGDGRGTQGNNNQRVSQDALGDQEVFIRDSGGTVLLDGVEFYLKTAFVFEIGGQQFTGYHFEQDATANNPSLDFTILPPDLPAGTATIISVDFAPSPDEVPYVDLTSGDEVINDQLYSNLDLSGADTIIAGDGDDTIFGRGGNDEIFGGAGDDIIRGNGGDDTIFGGAGEDNIRGNNGSDTIFGGADNDVILGDGTNPNNFGDDTIFGGAGEDTIDGGGGNDTIFGDGEEVLPLVGVDYSQIPDPNSGGAIDDGDDISGGFSLVAGGVRVDYAFNDPDTSGQPSGIDTTATFEFNNNTTQVVDDLNDGVDPGDDSLRLTGSGGNAITSTTTISFNSDDPAVQSQVRNVSFRVNDIDDGNFRDFVKVTATDASGAAVTVNLTAGAEVTLSDTNGDGQNDTATADQVPGVTSSSDPDASLLVEIPGPVQQIIIEYGNLDGGFQLIDVTELFFNPLAFFDPAGSDDTIDGGAGDDTIFGNVGDDTILISSGVDTIDGGAGNDTFNAFDVGTTNADETITVTVDNNGDGTIAKTNDGSVDIVTSVETFIADEAVEENDTITITANDLTAMDVSGLDDTSVGTYTALNGTVVAFGGAGEPTFSELIGGTFVLPGGGTVTGWGSFAITDGDESGQIGNIAFQNFENINFSIICFAQGTMIETPDGPVAVETLQTDDLVLTLDNGPQPLRWTGGTHLDAATLARKPHLQPIRIKAGALAPDMPKRDLVVSPQHRILLRSNIAIRMFDAKELFLPAKHLLGLPGVEIATDLQAVTYVHIMCDDHEIVRSEGALTETLYTGTEALKALSAQARREIDDLFGDAPYLNRPTARVVPEGRRARRLIARHIKNDKQVFEKHC